MLLLFTHCSMQEQMEFIFVGDSCDPHWFTECPLFTYGRACRNDDLGVHLSQLLNVE